MRRLWERIKADCGCWEWQGALNNKGYGVIGDNYKVVYVHRVAFEQVFGPIPHGMELDHLCRNTKCANPYHMDVVTHRTNILRGTSPMSVQARATHCMWGHELIGDAFWTDKRGRRHCLTCDYRRKKAARLEAGRKLRSSEPSQTPVPACQE